MVEKRETPGAAELSERRALKEEMGEVEDESLETEEMRDWKVRGDRWVSRLNTEHEADMISVEKGKGKEQSLNGMRGRGEISR
jgi:hypothetical protein